MKKLLFSFAFLWTAAAQASLQITSPNAGAELTGPVRFQVSVEGLSNVSTVELLNAGGPFSGRFTDPFAYDWNAKELWNSELRLVAVARDADNNIVGTSPEVRYIVRTTTPSWVVNGGKGLLTLTAPNISNPLSGTVSFTITHDFNDALLGNGIWQCGVDGDRAVMSFRSTPYPWTLDTRPIPNGPHTLTCKLSFENKYLNYPAVAWQSWPITISNPTAPGATVLSAIRPNYNEVYLVPGETVQLKAFQVDTAGTRTEVPVTWSIDEFQIGGNGDRPDRGTASIGADGTVVALSTGIVFARGVYGNFLSTATTRVIVNDAHRLAHFSKSGAFLDRYTPGQSWWVRSMFMLGPNETWGPWVQRAAINTFQSGFYSNPADGGAGATSSLLEQWRTGMDRSLSEMQRMAEKYDRSLLLTGDDLLRTGPEAYDTIMNDSSTAKVQHVFTWARDSGRVIGIDMVDETDMLWGCTPNPTPAASPWVNRSPPLPWNAITLFMDKINAVTNRSNITWPILGHQLNYYFTICAKYWMGEEPYSDYATAYWTPLGGAEGALYPDRGATNRVFDDFAPSIDFATKMLRRHRPILSLTGSTGPYYFKQGPGYEYTPGQDRLGGVGGTPHQVAGQVLYAAVRGMAGVRTYFFNPSLQNVDGAWIDIGKSQATPNDPTSDGLQTGASPLGEGSDRFAALSAAFNTVAELEPYLLEPQGHAPDLGDRVATTLREGPSGRLIMAINTGDTPRTVTLDLSPYAYAGSAYMTRYRQQGVTYGKGTVAVPAVDTLTLGAAETVAWLLQPGRSSPGDITAPSVPANGIARAVSDVQTDLTWNASADNPGGSGMKDYLVYRNGLEVGYSTGPFFSDYSLKGGRLYIYRVKARDNAGNVSDWSVPFSTRTLPARDRLEPWLTDVQASSITATTAVITWKSDKDADTKVLYSSDTANGPAGNLDQTQTAPMIGRDHRVTLTGLAPGTAYYFRVRSTAVSNNMLGQSSVYFFATLFDGPSTGAVRINSAGTAYVDKSSHTWQSDRFFFRGHYDGLPYAVSLNNTNGTPVSDVGVYRTFRSGAAFRYEIPLANGFYKMRLLFAEAQCLGVNLPYDGVGCRVFGATMNGETLFKDKDLFKDYGGNAAWDYVYPGDLKISDNKVVLEVTNAERYGLRDAMLSGIELVLNCSEGDMPKPALSLPKYLTVRAKLSAQYVDTCNIDHYEWLLHRDKPNASVYALAGSTRTTVAPTAAFTTRARSADLGSQSLQPGLYRIAVRAVNQAGNVSPEGEAFVELLRDGLDEARVYPNPWRADRSTDGLVHFDQMTIDTRVRVFDVAGHHVRSLTTEGGRATWDLKNESGQPVASGIYLYVLTAGDETARGKVVVIR